MTSRSVTGHGARKGLFFSRGLNPGFSPALTEVLKARPVFPTADNCSVCYLLRELHQRCPAAKPGAAGTVQCPVILRSSDLRGNNASQTPRNSPVFLGRWGSGLELCAPLTERRFIPAKHFFPKRPSDLEGFGRSPAAGIGL